MKKIANLKNSPDVYVSSCDVGRGVFASRRFARGERILTFNGMRVDANDPINNEPEGANLLQTGKRTYLLLNEPGLFLNHSCEPNAGIVNGRMLVALADIEKDEEIRFDYSTTMDDGLWTMDCKCLNNSCRGLITDFKELPNEIQDKYINLGIVPKYLVYEQKRKGIGVTNNIHA